MDIIRHPIKPEKQKAWHWRMHQYFTKQPSNVVAEYVEHYTKPGDTVLDPFGGTGVTAIEALRLGRKAIIADLNPLASFITKQTCVQIDTTKFLAAFHNLEAKVKDRIEELNRLSDVEVERIPLGEWYPKDIPLPKNADFDFVHELYTRRQLLVYSLLWDKIKKVKDVAIRDMLAFVFTATMAKVNLGYLKNNRGLEGGASSILVTYRYHKPKVTVELDV